jgi:uncharacterized protein YuzE
MGQKKLDKLNLNVRYDTSADVLYISFGTPRPGIATEFGDGELVRLDPDTNEIVGVTILDFKERYMPKPSISIEESAQKIISKVLKEFRV